MGFLLRPKRFFGVACPGLPFGRIPDPVFIVGVYRSEGFPVRCLSPGFTV